MAVKKKATKKKAKKSRLSSGPPKPRMILDPTWDGLRELKEWCKNTYPDQAQALFPEDYGKALHEEGSWVLVTKPPPCEYTVPPFSIWFAVPWDMDVCKVQNFPLKRVRITTPIGDLGLFPEEYSLVEDMTKYVGEDASGVMPRKMDGAPIVPKDMLHYIMSRGIKKGEAMMMMINLIKEPRFMWFEIAPQYGEYFGREWPSPEQCSFCTRRELWVDEAEVA